MKFSIWVTLLGLAVASAISIRSEKFQSPTMEAQCLAGDRSEEDKTVDTTATTSSNKVLDSKQALNALFAGQLDFSIDLFKTLMEASMSSAAKNTNLFLSPFSIHSALLLAYFGAQGNTEKELERVLGLKNIDKLQAAQAFKAAKLLRQASRVSNVTKYDFDMANKLYFDETKEVKQCMRNIFEEDLRVVDFANESEQVLQEINTMVSEVTRGKIPNFLTSDAINSQTKLALVNAAYFKGQWASQFKAANTRLSTFFNGANEFAITNMMFQKGSYRHAASEELQAHILEMPYLGGDVSFYILLPPFLPDGLETTLSRLNGTTLRQAMFSTFPVNLELGLPRFKLTQDIDLPEVLAELGLKDLFDNQAADLSGFNGKKDSSITAAKHQALIEVNEEGSEAAGATALIDVRIARPRGPTKFICDHPFIFFIYDNVFDSILFMGAYRNPKQL